MIGNNVNLIGRLTKDPEIRSVTLDGKPVDVCNMRLAVSRRGKKDEADFISLVAWRQEATNAATYLRKGSQIAVVGHIQTGSYKKGEQTIYTTDVVCDEIKYLTDWVKGGIGAEAAEADEVLPDAAEPTTDLF